MKTIITRNGEEVKSSCEPLDVSYNRADRIVRLIDTKSREEFQFDVIDERLGWLTPSTTGNSEIFVEFTVK